MKKLALLFCICMGLLCPFGLAQAQHTIIKSNMLGLDRGVFEGGFELRYAPQFSLNVGGILTNFETSPDNSFTERSYGIEVEGRIYPFSGKKRYRKVGYRPKPSRKVFTLCHERDWRKESLEKRLKAGIYWGIWAKYRNIDLFDIALSKTSYSAGSIGFDLGYQLNWSLLSVEAGYKLGAERLLNDNQPSLQPDPVGPSFLGMWSSPYVHLGIRFN